MGDGSLSGLNGVLAKAEVPEMWKILVASMQQHTVGMAMLLVDGQEAREDRWEMALWQFHLLLPRAPRAGLAKRHTCRDCGSPFHTPPVVQMCCQRDLWVQPYVFIKQVPRHKPTTPPGAHPKKQVFSDAGGKPGCAGL